MSTVSGNQLPLVPELQLEVSITEQAEVMEFGDWRSMFGKNYSGTELETRAAIFADTVQLIQKHNAEADAGLHTFRLGVNQFSAMTDEVTHLDAEVGEQDCDVSPVKDQGSSAWLAMPPSLRPLR